MKFESQFVRTAMLVALPLASDANNSEVMSQGIAPSTNANQMLHMRTFHFIQITWSDREEYNVEDG